MQESKKSYLTPLKNLNYDILLPIRESFYTVRLRREHSLALITRKILMWDPNLDWMLFSFGLYEPSCQCRRFDRCVFTILRPLGSRFILQCIHPVMRSFLLSFECSLCAHRCAHTCSAIVIVFVFDIDPQTNFPRTSVLWPSSECYT